MMRVGVAYSRGLSFEGLCVGRVRRNEAGRRQGPYTGSPLHHHACPRVAAAVLCDIAVGAFLDHRRCLLALQLAGTALPMILDGEGGRDERQRSLPVDRNALMAWTSKRLVRRPAGHQLPIPWAWSLYACGPVTLCARVDRSKLNHAES